MKKVARALVACGLITATITSAGAEAVNWQTMSTEQLSKLTPEQLAPLPLLEVGKKIQPDYAAMLLPAVSMALSRLYYGMSVPMMPFETYVPIAVREFQQDIGATADGLIKAREFDDLISRANRVNRDASPIFPSTEQKISISGDLATFGGTWIIEGEKHAFPVNYSLYKCWKSRALCDVSEGIVYRPAGPSGTMNITSETWKVIKWDAAEILMESSAACRVTTISANIASKEVFQMTRNNGDSCGDDAVLPKLASPRIARLVDGLQVISSLHNQERDESNKLLSHSMQKVMSDLKESSERLIRR
ncbi:hypothetical protein [Terrihabitans rhizophilus]|uniref:Uncharacterized protein n=1 Tax=Terrihabitans rhizophilus TaxID=3092662 RepID=A0ABU4RQQ7_9HYPH|nr:hypothetical protein [Terrihabitans sp. PJ23]MDX6806439.1 hypothetical protein [Terrihabitans sp. PJ23]